MTIIARIEQLEEIYGPPLEPSTVKVLTALDANYRAYVEASPFMALATVGPEGLDCSPRGGDGPVVRVVDPKTLVMPDRRGNNRIDSLRNIARDPRCAFLFLVPGSGTCLRVNGQAVVSVEPALLESFAVKGQPPRSCVVLTIDEVYFQCARAIVRSGLWDPARFVDPATLPTPGAMLAAVSAGRVGGDAYDREWPQRAARTMW